MALRLLSVTLATMLAVTGLTAAPASASGPAPAPGGTTGTAKRATAAAVGTVNLAAGRPVTAGSTNNGYPASNATDGNQASYWESANNSFPQWIQVDLGSTATGVGRVVLKLPTGWERRTQTLSIQGSTDGSTFSTLSGSAGRVFDPGVANTVTVDFTATSTRYVRVNITANTGWPAGQVSELEVYGDDPGSGPDPGTNLALGKEVAESGHVYTFAAANAVDGDLNTYWEANSGAFPNTLTVKLGANVATSQVTLKLNPSGAWGTRTQNIEIQGREQSSSSYTTLKPAADYTFDPATGNSVNIPVFASVADMRLKFNSNTGAPGGQVAEFQVFGTAAPNPDLVVTAASWTPASPVETDAITLSATVKNQGNAGSAASKVGLYLGDTKVGTADVGALAAGASATVSANIGPRAAGTYQVTAKADEAGTVVERNESNNSFTAPGSLTVRPVDSSDLVPVPAWSPGNPAGGANVTFTVALRNQGNVASASGAHAITLTVLNDSGGTVKTLTGTYNGAIAAGATTSPVSLGTWTAANGRYTVRAVVADDGNELPVKRANNTLDQSLFVGRGANMPYDHYEAEDAVTGGGAAVVGPSRDIGTLAGEASGRRAVTLNGTGAYVEFTTKAATNTLVTRFSIPDAPGGGGITSTVNVYVNGQFHKTLNLTSKYMWLYGAEASPNNSPGNGSPRHIYDEANLMLNQSYPAGTKIRLQKDAANSSTYAIDFVDTEQVAPVANPDPAKYVVPAGFGQQDVAAALDKARMEAGWTGVYLPAGDYQVSSKFNVYGKAVKVVGAGPWYTRFYAPSGQENTDIGFEVNSSANGSSFSGFAVFGNYTQRNDGPGKVFNLTGVRNITIDDLWIEHQMCMVWATNVSNVTVTDSRIRDLFADGINFTNNSRNNTVRNVEARSTGDDSFALFNAVDIAQGDVTGNVFENLSVMTPWRAAGIAVYGGYDNVFRNIYIADTLTYSGVTISSLDFGYPFRGFGTTPTRFENISIVRSGGHFWGQQTFPGMWLFSASKEFRGIRISDVDIVDPTYSGIMFQTKYSSNQPENPITDTVLTNVTISGARRSGDAFDAKSGFGIWVNEMPEQGQGPAVGSATFTNLTLTNNYQDIKNTTTTFTINRN